MRSSSYNEFKKTLWYFIILGGIAIVVLTLIDTNLDFYLDSDIQIGESNLYWNWNIFTDFFIDIIIVGMIIVPIFYIIYKKIQKETKKKR